MKKQIFLVAAACCMFSCDYIMKGNDTKPEGIGDEKVVIGTDKDAKGCVISAGYRWSMLKDDCVRPLEEGYRLNTVDQVAGESTYKSAFVTFDEDRTTAELFLPDTRSSILLKKAKNNTFADKHYTLALQGGYRLNKDGQLLYVGAAVEEGQVTGDDKQESE